LPRGRRRKGSYQSCRPVVSIASIHAKSNELFETLSWRIAAIRRSFFVKNFGWPFCINGINQSLHRSRSAAAFSESSWLRLFVIEHAQPQAGADNPDRGFGEYGSVEPFSMRRTRLRFLRRPAQSRGARVHLRVALQKPGCTKPRAASRSYGD